MKIGILQAGHIAAAVQEAAGDYTALYSGLLKGHGFTHQTWSVVDMAFPESPLDADGWLISGSRHGAYEDHPFIPPLEEFIRAIVATDRPLVGICFGHQIIAQALGGTVEKFPGGWAVGHQNYTMDGEALQLNAWHQDQVVTRPAGATRLGGNDFCENAMLLYEDKALTVQPHPEFGPVVIDKLIESYGAPTVPEPLLERARGLLDAPDDNQTIADKIAYFLKEKSLP
jgi:GMP synthase-like glutamine amidotransferase